MLLNGFTLFRIEDKKQQPILFQAVIVNPGFTVLNDRFSRGNAKDPQDIALRRESRLKLGEQQRVDIRPPLLAVNEATLQEQWKHEYHHPPSIAVHALSPYAF